MATATVSSDYAAQREMVQDAFTAIERTVRNAFGLMARVNCYIAEPPLSPSLGVVAIFDRSFPGDRMPIAVEARLMDCADAIDRSLRDCFPSLPMKVEVLRQPVHARFGLVVSVTDTAPKPIYPRIVRAKAVLRPTAWYRTLLGLGPKE